MMKNQELKKGYTCPYCQRFNEFSVWVFAHMNIDIQHTCDCGKIIPLKNGEILFHELTFKKEDSDADQAIMYNSLAMMLNVKMKENPGVPIGDIFFQTFGDLIYGGEKPLFLLKKGKKTTMKNIESELTKYILEIL